MLNQDPALDGTLSFCARFLRSTDMRLWEASSLVFFGYMIAIALASRRLTSRRRLIVFGSAAIGAALVGASVVWPLPKLLTEWLLPPAALLIAYWTSGLLFVAPDPTAEAALVKIDSSLRVRELAKRVPNWLTEVLEFAYAAVYPAIPVALILYLVYTAAPDASQFWAVVLVTDFICFAVLPWVQTRAPRSLEPQPPWRARFRRVNLMLVGSASTGVNTFPSGHAAEALAAALLLSHAPLPVFLCMLVVALAISAGAVLGRYHYAADAIAGWGVAAVVWGLIC
jgi:membrane-associated phospholipid phosphatase